jgi:phage terminase Nu1 subunit (DNA packaging protein)
VKAGDALDQSISQAEFASIIGVSEARVSQLVADGVIVRGDTAQEWILAYCERLRDMAAGRASEAGGLDLVQERAALAREQRIGVMIKNAVARGEFAPITLLAEVLASASQSVSERFEQLPGALKKACPDLPEAARDAVMAIIAEARNEWVRATEALVVQRAESVDDDLPVDEEALEP